MKRLIERDVWDDGIFLKIAISKTKVHVIPEFVITGENIDGVNFVDLIRRYTVVVLYTIRNTKLTYTLDLHLQSMADGFLKHCN